MDALSSNRSGGQPSVAEKQACLIDKSWGGKIKDMLKVTEALFMEIFQILRL